MVTAIGSTPATLSIPSIIKIVNCSSGNLITGGDWNANQLFTELTGVATSDLAISDFTFSKPECGLSAYSISGSGASI